MKRILSALALVSSPAGEDFWGALWKPAEKTGPGPMSEALRTGRAVERGGTLYAVSEGRLLHYTADGKLLGEVKHASALAVTDGDQVLAAVGTEVVELPAGGTL